MEHGCGSLDTLKENIQWLQWKGIIMQVRGEVNWCKPSQEEMTKDAHYEKSSQQLSEDLTNNLADLTRGRNGHKPEHLLFFLLVFLKNKTICK